MYQELVNKSKMEGFGSLLQSHSRRVIVEPRCVAQTQGAKGEKNLQLP